MKETSAASARSEAAAANRAAARDGSPSSREESHLMDVVLEGGPDQFPEELRFQRVAAAEEKVKIQYNGGYEHFERDVVASPPGHKPVVFRWTGRTRIAE